MRLVDADKLITEIKDEQCFDCLDNYCDLCWVRECFNYLEKAPTVEAEPIRHGHWKEFDDDTNSYECSVCGEVWTLNVGTPKENMMYFCSRCGAKMDEEAGNDK